MRCGLAILLLAALAAAGPVEDAAEAVLKAYREKGDLAELGAKDAPDPWLVADELCFRGEHDAAAAFAKAAPRPDTEKLPAYIESQRGKSPDVAAREALAARDLAAIEAATSQELDVAQIRLRCVRGAVLRDRRPKESGRAFLDAADAAARLGWLARAAGALREASASLYRASDWRATLATARRQLAVETARGDRAGTAAALANIGLAQQRMGEYRKALGHQERALAVFRELGDEARVAATLGNVGNTYQWLGEYEKALEYHGRALAAHRAAGDRTGEMRALGNIGIVHWRRGEHGEAIERQEESLRLAGELGHETGVARALGNLGNCQLERGEYADALRHLRRAREILERLGNRAGAATVLGNLGVAHRALGEHAQALECQRRALRILDALGDRAGAARALGNIGIHHSGLGGYTKALEYQERALRIHEAIGNRAGAARTLGNMGDVFALLGEYGRALECEQRALELSKRIRNHQDLADVLADIGGIHLEVGDFGKALRYQRDSLRVRETLADDAGVARTLSRIGVTCKLLGRFDEALESHRGALELAEAIGDRDLTAEIHRYLGLLHDARGEHRKAVESLRRSLAILKDLRNRAAEVLALGNLGAVLHRLEEFDEAEACYLGALRPARELRMAHARLWAANLGLLRLDQGRPAEAVPLLEEAIAAVEAQREAVLGFSDRVRAAYFRELGRAEPYRGLARAKLLLGQPGEALEALERGRARAVLDLLARSRLDPLREAERRARERGDEGRLASIEEVTAKLSAADREVRALTYALSQRQTAAGREALTERLRTARDAQDDLLGKRALLVRDLVPVGAPASLAAIQRALGPKERMLFYSVGERGSLLFVVPPPGRAVTAYGLRWADGEPVTHDTLADAAQAHLARLVNRGTRRRGVVPTETAPGVAAGRLLDALVPEAVRKELGGLDRVYVVPHGSLHRIPLESLDALPPVVYAHSASVLLWCKRRRAEQRPASQRYDVVALGDPVFPAGSSLERLPGTRREVEAIAKAIEKTAALLGDEATEERLSRLAPQARFLHLATHQLADGAAHHAASRLALSGGDGFLSLFELLEKWRDRLSACELVVLSACETVEGPLQDDEGLYAMPLGFLYAGAPAVIGSLWHVDDASTAELFADFYRRLASGTPKLEAFTEARKALRKKYPEPYYWAPFVYIGDPR